MTPIAITVFVLSAGVLWGGLAWSIIRLRKYPDDQPDSHIDE
jgi:hypothetical protein